MKKKYIVVLSTIICIFLYCVSAHGSSYKLTNKSNPRKFFKSNITVVIDDMSYGSSIADDNSYKSYNLPVEAHTEKFLKSNITAVIDDVSIDIFTYNPELKYYSSVEDYQI